MCLPVSKNKPVVCQEDMSPFFPCSIYPQGSVSWQDVAVAGGEHASFSSPPRPPHRLMLSIRDKAEGDVAYKRFKLYIVTYIVSYL